MLTNKIEPTKVNIPHEDGQWISFAPLSWSQLQEAGRQRRLSALAVYKDMPSSMHDLLDKAQEEAKTAATETKDEDSVAEADAGASYDKATVLKSSIKAWSYDDPVSPKNIDALDEQTAEWAFDTAVAMNTRSKSEGEGSAPNSNDSISETGATQQN